jgi:nitronate monooxygenase
MAGRLMRELGPLADAAAPFPTAGGAIGPLRAKAEAEGRSDYTNQWAGQAARLSPRMEAGALTRMLAADGLERLAAL